MAAAQQLQCSPYFESRWSSSRPGAIGSGKARGSLAVPADVTTVTRPERDFEGFSTLRASDVEPSAEWLDARSAMVTLVASRFGPAMSSNALSNGRIKRATGCQHNLRNSTRSTTRRPPESSGNPLRSRGRAGTNDRRMAGPDDGDDAGHGRGRPRQSGSRRGGGRWGRTIAAAGRVGPSGFVLNPAGGSTSFGSS